MLPDYLVDGYETAFSSSELKGDFTNEELDGLCPCLGTTIGDVESTEWHRYVWSRGYIAYPEDHSEIRNGNAFVVLYEELDTDETVEAVIGSRDSGTDTVVTIFGPSKDIPPLEISGIGGEGTALYRDIRNILKFLVKMDLYSRDKVIQSVRESLHDFSKSLDY